METMTVNDAIKTAMSIIPYRYNVPSEQVEKAKETIWNAAKDGNLIEVNDLLGYCHKVAEINQKLMMDCISRSYKEKNLNTVAEEIQAAQFFEKQFLFWEYDVEKATKAVLDGEEESEE